MPQVFSALRGLIDQDRRDGRGTGRLLVPVSASVNQLKQSGKTLASRISYVELKGLQWAAELIRACVELRGLRRV